MREITFRGMRYIDEIWEYGSLYINENDEAFIDIANWKREPVIRETIGQYTGLKDENGEEIYEGDIVNGTMPDSEKDKRFEGMVIEFQEDSFIITKPNHEYFGSLASPVLNKCIKVIGNIYENPELQAEFEAMVKKINEEKDNG